MAEISGDCPRCSYDKVTFDVLGMLSVAIRFDWQHTYEVYCVCRHCRRGTILVARDINPDKAKELRSLNIPSMQGSLNNWVNVFAFVSTKDRDAEDPPEFLPPKIEEYFKEGSQCIAIGCYNASGTMFRLCLDTATKAIVETISKEIEIPKKVKYSLGFRLEWLFENGYLDKGLEELAECVKEDGNDGAHDGTLNEADANDIHDFTVALLERLYTEPAKLTAAKERRAARRQLAAN